MRITTFNLFNHTLTKASRVLEATTRLVPGLIEAVFLLAKTKFLGGGLFAFSKFSLFQCYDLHNDLLIYLSTNILTLTWQASMRLKVQSNTA